VLLPNPLVTPVEISYSCVFDFLLISCHSGSQAAFWRVPFYQMGGISGYIMKDEIDKKKVSG
jgi:hypothetical protein